MKQLTSLVRLGRHKVRDIAYQFKMPAGFPGDVNRSHPADIEPALADPTNPPTSFGQAVVGNPVSGGVRALIAGDSGTTIYGVLARAYPTQQALGGLNSAFGVGGPNANATVSVLRNGYIMVPVVGAPTKFAPVFIWIGVTGAGHTFGGFEAVAAGVSTAQLANASFNGGPDANGVCELILNF